MAHFLLNYSKKLNINFRMRQKMPEQETPEILENWREHFEALFSNLPIGISYLTPDMRYIRINPFLEENWDLSPRKSRTGTAMTSTGYTKTTRSGKAGRESAAYAA